MPAEKESVKIAAQNKKAYHDYFVEDTYEAGIALSGTEVKSIRAGTVNMKDSYCTIEEGELFATGIHISPYEKGNVFNKDPLRDRKLLMHKREILKLFGLVGKEGYTLVPLKMYLKAHASKWKWDFAKVKSCMTSVIRLPKRKPDADIERAMKERNRY